MTTIWTENYSGKVKASESLQIKAIESGALEVKPRPMGAESVCPTCKGTGMRVVDSLRLTDDDPENLGDAQAGYRGATMKPTHYLPCTDCNQVGYIMDADDTIDRQTESLDTAFPNIDPVPRTFPPEDAQLGVSLRPEQWQYGGEQIPVYGEDDLKELQTGILDDIGNYRKESKASEDRFGDMSLQERDELEAGWQQKTGDPMDAYGPEPWSEYDDGFIDGSDVPRDGHYESKAKIRKTDKTYGTIPKTKEEYEEYEKEHGYRFGYGDYDVFLDYDQNRYNIPRPDIHQRQVESKAKEDAIGNDNDPIYGDYDKSDADQYYNDVWRDRRDGIKKGELGLDRTSKAPIDEKLEGEQSRFKDPQLGEDVEGNTVFPSEESDSPEEIDFYEIARDKKIDKKMDQDWDNYVERDAGGEDPDDSNEWDSQEVDVSNPASQTSMDTFSVKPSYRVGINAYDEEKHSWMGSKDETRKELEKRLANLDDNSSIDKNHEGIYDEYGNLVGV